MDYHSSGITQKQLYSKIREEYHKDNPLSHTKPISIINTLEDSRPDTVQRQQASTVTHNNEPQEL